jgi:hypothetical protein
MNALVFFAVPALVLSHPPSSKPSASLHEILESLEGVPESVVDAKLPQTPMLAKKSARLWARHRAVLSSLLAPDDLLSVDAHMKALIVHATQASSEQCARSAIAASRLLTKHVSPERKRQLMVADLSGMEAWMDFKKGSSTVDLEGAFNALREGDAAHAKVWAQVDQAFATLDAAEKNRDYESAKRQVKRLLDLVDDLERAPGV